MSAKVSRTRSFKLCEIVGRVADRVRGSQMSSTLSLSGSTSRSCSRTNRSKPRTGNSQACSRTTRVPSRPSWQSSGPTPTLPSSTTST